MAITSISTPSAFTISSGDIGSSRAGITTSSSFNDWRKYTNLIAEDTEDLATAINAINSAGAPAASPAFTGFVTVPLLTYIANPTAADEKQAAPRIYVDDRIATVDNYNSWKLKINNAGEVSIATGKKVDFINASNSAITVTKSESPSGEFNIQHSFSLSNVNSGTLANARLPDLTVANLASSAKQLSGSTFADNDTSVLTAAAIDDRISTRLTNFTTGDIDAAVFVSNFGLAKSLGSAGTGLDGGGSANNAGQITGITLDFNELAINASTNTNDYFIVGDRSSGTTIDGVPDRAKFSTIDITHLNYNNKISLNELSNVDDTFSPLVNSSSASGSILRYQNGEWQTSTAPLSDTTYSAGTGLDITSTTFSLENSASLSTDQIMKWDGNSLANAGVSVSSSYFNIGDRGLFIDQDNTAGSDAIIITAYVGPENNGVFPLAKHSIFTNVNTRKSGINLGRGSVSTDNGYIVHESGVDSSDNNKGVLHLCPGDDADNVNDVVVIHGVNQPTSGGLILGTAGDIKQVNDLIFRPAYGTTSTNITNNTLSLARSNSNNATARRGGSLRLAKGNHDDMTQYNWGIISSSGLATGVDDFVIYDTESGSTRADLRIKENTGVIEAPRATPVNIAADHDLVTLEKMVEYTDTRIALKLFGPRPVFTIQVQCENGFRQSDKGKYDTNPSNGFIKIQFETLGTSGFQKHDTLNKYMLLVRAYTGKAAQDASLEAASFLTSTTESIGLTTIKSGADFGSTNTTSGAQANVGLTVEVHDMVTNRQYITRLPTFTGYNGHNGNILRVHKHNALSTGAATGTYGSNNTAASPSNSFFAGALGLSASLIL